MHSVFADPDVIREAEEARAFHEAYGCLLRRYRWDDYATLTFRFEVGLEQAKKAVEEWVAVFGPQAYAVVAFEVGGVGGRLHVHALLGGLIGELAKAKAGRLWKCGDAVSERYSPRGRAAEYLTKTFYRNPEASEWIGNLKRTRRRKRGKKKRGNRDVTHET